MTASWIITVFLLFVTTLQQFDCQNYQRYYCLSGTLNIQTERIEEKVSCSRDTDIIQIIDIFYVCEVFDCDIPDNMLFAKVPDPNSKVKSIFSRICNGKKACSFEGADIPYTLRSHANEICQMSLDMIFRVGIRCSAEEKMIDICQGPSEGMGTYTQTPYIYSSNYPHPLPKHTLTCQCVLSAVHSHYAPYIGAVLMQFRGQTTGDEQVAMEFMYSNGSTKTVSFQFVAYNDSDPHSSNNNTQHDLTQPLIVMDTFTKWKSIQLKLMKHHSALSAGRYMFVFGKTTKVECLPIHIETVTGKDTTMMQAVTNVHGDVTGLKHSEHTLQAMRTHEQTTMLSTSILTSDTDISLNGQSELSADVLDVTTLPSLIKSRQKSSNASKNIGVLFGSVAAGLVICVTVLLISCIIYKKRNKKKTEGHSRASDISFKNFSVEDEDMKNIALSICADPIASSIKTKCNDTCSDTTDIPLDDVIRTRNSQKSASIHIKPETDQLSKVGENNGKRIDREDVEIFQRNSAYVSADALSPNDSPLLQHRNSVYASAEVSQENDVSVISSPDSANNSQTQNNNKEMNTSQSNDEVLSVTAAKTNESYLDENSYYLYDDSHRKLDLPKKGFSNEKNKEYDEAIPVRKEADATAVYTTEPVSRAMKVDSLKVRSLDRRDFPDYAYAYAKTRGDGSFKVVGSSSDYVSNAYTYIKTSDENMTRKPDAVLGPSPNEQPYSYADLRGRVVRGITEHIRVPGYDLEQMETNNSCDMEKNEYDLEQGMDNTEYDLEETEKNTAYGKETSVQDTEYDKKAKCKAHGVEYDLEQNLKDTEHDPKHIVKHTEYDVEQNVKITEYDMEQHA